MEILERLAHKIRQAADELTELKFERRRLSSEVDALRDQLKDHQILLRENDRMRQDQDRLRGRLLRIQKRLEKSLIVGSPVLPGTEGEADEEHPQ